MPLFSYKCKHCEQVVEKFQHNPDNTPSMTCDNCESTEFERLLGSSHNRTVLNPRDNLHENILPDAKKMQENMSNGKDSVFLDLYGEN